MDKSKSLGSVIKVYESGNVQTNQGHIIQGKFAVGDILFMNEKRKVFAQDKFSEPYKSEKEIENRKFEKKSSSKKESEGSLDV